MSPAHGMQSESALLPGNPSHPRDSAAPTSPHELRQSASPVPAQRRNHSSSSYKRAQRGSPDSSTLAHYPQSESTPCRQRFCCEFSPPVRLLTQPPRAHSPQHQPHSSPD